MRPLSPEAKGVEQFVIDALYDLADCGYPLPQAFGPASLAGVALGRMDDICTVALEPAPVVFFALEALVSNVSPREGRSHGIESGVRICAEVEEGLCQRLVGSRGGPETKARNDPRVGSVAVSRQKPSYHPRLLLDQPM